MSPPPQVPATDRNALNSLWGKLASEILMQNWEAAMEDLTRLRETIDNNVNAPHFSEFDTSFSFPYTDSRIDISLAAQPLLWHFIPRPQALI